MKSFNELTAALYGIIIFTVLYCSCGKPKETGQERPSASENATTNNAASSAVKSTREPDLFQASLDGDITRVSTLLKQGAPVNATDPNGRTPLMLAAFNGHVEIIDRLLAAGAKVNTCDAIGRTALMFASSGPFPSVVALLCKHGADVNIVDTQERWTALMFAAAEGHRENVRILLDNKADPTLKDSDGDDAAVFALQKGHNDIATMLAKYRPEK